MGKQKTCPVCKSKWQPFSSLEKVCSIRCAVKQIDLNKVKAKAKEEKAFRAETKRLKEAIKPRGKWLKEAQAAFNKFIRLRDHKEPCISCDKPAAMDRRYLFNRGGDWDCGHYRSVGSMPSIRFEELNAHKQCKKCNQFLSGNVADYRIRLIKKIGEDKLAWVEGPHEPKKYTIEDLKEIKKTYTQKAKELENEYN